MIDFENNLPNELISSTEPLPGTTLEDRVKRLEELMKKHAHTGYDGTQNLSRNTYVKVFETTLLTATNEIRIPVKDGKQVFRLTMMGGMSAKGYPSIRLNDNSGSSYAYNVTVFEAGAFDPDSVSVNSLQNKGFIALWDDAGNNFNSLECTITDLDDGIKNWISLYHAVSTINTENYQSGIATGMYSTTAAKVSVITLLPSTGNFNAGTNVILEALRYA